MKNPYIDIGKIVFLNIFVPLVISLFFNIEALWWTFGLYIVFSTPLGVIFLVEDAYGYEIKKYERFRELEYEEFIDNIESEYEQRKKLLDELKNNA